MFEDNALAGLLMQMFITYAQTQNPHHHPARPRKPTRRRIRRTTAPFAYGRFNTKDEPARKQAEVARQSPRARRDASTRAHEATPRVRTTRGNARCVEHKKTNPRNGARRDPKKYQVQTGPGEAKFPDPAAVQMWCFFN